MNPETAVTCTHRHFNHVVFARKLLTFPVNILSENSRNMLCSNRNVESLEGVVIKVLKEGLKYTVDWSRYIERFHVTGWYIYTAKTK